MVRTKIAALLVVFALCCVFTVGDKKVITDYQYNYDTACCIIVKEILPDGRPTQHYGSGTIINNKAHPYVLSSLHILKGENGILFKDIVAIKGNYKDGKWPIKLSRAKIVAYSESLDTVILELSDDLGNFNVAKLSDSHYSLGDEVYYYGIPGLIGPNYLYSGRISQKNLLLKDEQTLDAINVYGIGGNSGSGVFLKDKMIGVISMGLRDANQMAFIKVTDIKKKVLASGIFQLTEILEGRYHAKLSENSQEPIKF